MTHRETIKNGGDLNLTSECQVVIAKGGHKAGHKFHIRIGPDGWHKNGELLTYEQAKILNEALQDYLEKAKSKPNTIDGM